MTGRESEFAIIYSERGKKKNPSKEQKQNEKETKTMESYTNLKMTMENKSQAIKAAEMIAEIAAMRTPESPNELKNFLECVDVKRNMVIVDESCSLWENTFLEMMPEIIRVCAALTIQKYEALAWHNSCNCGYAATIEAERSSSALNMRTVVSENGDGFCEECGEQIVCYDEYDPDKTYFCPECGEELDHEKMFDGVLPVITKETFEIK